MRKIFILLALALSVSLISRSQVVSTTTGGNWSDPATWVGASIPTPTDQVIIADGANVVIDVNATVLGLTVGQGSGGLLRFQAIGSVTLTVSSDILINPGATFRTSLTGTETGHELVAGGNLINNGILDFSNNGNAATAAIRFTGAANAIMGGTGTVTDVDRITIDKGNSVGSVLELNPSVFTMQGSGNTPALFEGFLTIINGMFKIGGSFTMSNGLFSGTGNYTIPPTGGLWMANPNYTVLGRNGTGYLEGTLIMDAGVLNVGNSTGNRLGYIDGTVVIINGGEINVASRFTATTTYGVSYTQTGGTITLNTVENPRDLYASFDIRPIDNSTFNMSGGKIVLQHANISGTGPRDYNMVASNMNITGGTLQIGNASTVGLDTFYIQGFAPDIEINNASGPKVIKMLNNVTARNITIASGCTLKLHDDVNGYVYTQKGPSLVNEGVIDGTLAGSSLVFSGELGLAQVYDGSGAILSPLVNLTVNNTQPLTFSNTAFQDINTLSLSLNSGNIFLGGNTLVLGTDQTTPGNYSYGSGTLIGKFRRWITASVDSWSFPVGIAGFTRTAVIDFTVSPASAGTLTAEFIAQPGGFNGLPITEGLNTVLNTASDGYWRISAADGLSGGTYTGTFTANGFNTITDFSRLVLVKRADELAPWVLDGTHIPTTGNNILAVASRSGMSGFSDFAVGGDLFSLPVTLEYFRGRTTGDQNILEWLVSCTNTPGVNMELQHSQDARVFKSIYSRYATAPECRQPFMQTDRSPGPGINYYRLKLADADGKITYSAVVALFNKASGFRIVQVMPNPAQVSAKLQIASAEVVNIELVISDMWGRKLSSLKASLQPGNNLIDLPVENLSRGVYQVSAVMEDGEIQAARFIRQ